MDAPAVDFSAAQPFVLLVIGVNGSGKTTTIGKLASKLQSQGKSVLLAAGDTFRAAATEQLEVWGAKVGAPVVRGKEGGDPSSVVFDSVKRARSEGIDVVIADTAGRLHTKTNLMEELQKVRRVTGKALEGAPHETWLVIDATSGQNAIAQAQVFTQAMSVTGIVLTKLDGTAKGGVIWGSLTSSASRFATSAWANESRTCASLRRRTSWRPFSVRLRWVKEMSRSPEPVRRRNNYVFLVDLLILPVLHCPHLALHSQAFEIKAIFDMG